MKTKFLIAFLQIALLLGLLTPATQAAAQTESTSSLGTSPAGMLNADGTLNLDKGFSGSLDLSGYSVEMDPKRGPVFGPAGSAAAVPSDEWDNVGDGSGALKGIVYAIAVSGTDVYVGGSFENADSLPAADYIAKWDGVNWSALGADSLGNGSLKNTVYALAVSGTDLYAGGQFSDVWNGGGSLDAADYIAKWNGSVWSALGGNGAGGGSINSFVYAIAVNGTDVYAGGAFTDVNNNGALLTAADRIAKWNGTNWSALGSDGAGGGSLNGDVKAIAVSGTNIYAGGFFTDVNNGGTVLGAADYIAKWDGANWSALGSNGSSNGSLLSGVRALAVSGTDLYVGGSFTDINNGGTTLTAADKIAKWDGSNWSALGSNGAGNGSLTSTVTAITIVGTDIYAGGDFTNVNNGGTSLTAADYIAKWDTLTGNWSALGSNGAGDGSLPVISGNLVWAIAAKGSGVVAGGIFHSVNTGGTVLNNAEMIAHWDAADWSALGANPNGSLNGDVNAVAVSGTDVYVGGYFTDVDNHGVNLAAADYIAKWDGANWSALGSNGAGNGSLTSFVSSIAVSGADVYVGGNFNNVNNGGASLTAADKIAKWDALTGNWSALGSNGAGNGSLNAYVDTLAVSGTDLYVGGSFTDVNNGGTSLAAADYIAKWDGVNWSALGSNGAGGGSLNSSPYVITVSGANAYVGGAFTDVNNGGTILGAADYIAKWDGINWSALGSNGAADGSLPSGSYIAAIAVSGTDVYAGGYFLNLNNNGTVLGAADNIAKWDALTGNWSALGSNGAGDGALWSGDIRAIVVSGTDVYIGGSFYDVKNNSNVYLFQADHVARFDGSQWLPLSSDGMGGGSLNTWVTTMSASGGDLLVGGFFMDANNNGAIVKEADYLAAYGMPTTPDTTPPTVVSITRADASPTSAATVNFTVTFSESVTGLDSNDFILTTSGVSGATLSGISSSGSIRTVTVNTGGGNGTLRLDVVDDDSIMDLSSNPLGGTGVGNGDFTTGEVYTVTDTTAPTVQTITRDYTNPTSLLAVDFIVTFSEPVTGVDLTDFALTTTGVSSASLNMFTGSSAAYRVTVNTGTASGTIRLDLTDDDSILDAVGNPLGGAGAGNGNFTSGEVYTVNKTVTFNSSASLDGWILESTETSGSGGSMNKNATQLYVGDDATNRQYLSLLSFDTSSLPDNAVITKVTLKFKYAALAGTSPFGTHGNLLVDIRKGGFGGNSALQLGDFKAVPSKLKALAYNQNKPANWYSRSFKTADFNKLNKLGVTQFRLRFAKDDNNDLGADFLKIFSGNAGAANRPQLIVEYFVP